MKYILIEKKSAAHVWKIEFDVCILFEGFVLLNLFDFANLARIWDTQSFSYNQKCQLF